MKKSWEREIPGNIETEDEEEKKKMWKTNGLRKREFNRALMRQARDTTNIMGRCVSKRSRA